MKRKILIALLITLNVNAYSQNKNNVKEVAKTAEKIFTWDIEKSEKGTMMFLDVPYQRDTQNSEEYLTLTVAKGKSQERPAFISVIIPNNIKQSNGIFIKFGKTIKTKENSEWKTELEKRNPVKVNFEKCNDETCTARIIGGYVTDNETNEKVDIFQKCLEFDHIYFLFVYADGSHKSVAIPLFSFKKQYKQLL